MNIGQQYNFWTIIDESEKKNGRKAWFCRCDCGTVRSVEERRLKDGKSKSCGCLAIRNMNEAKRKDYDTKTREYSFWCKYKRIEEWNSFEGFQNWLNKNNYDSNKHSLRIINTNDILSPQNCLIINSNECGAGENNPTSILYDFNGKKMNITQIARECNLSPSNLSARLKTSPLEIAILPSKEYREAKLKLKHLEEKKQEYIPYMNLDCTPENNKHGVYMISNKINSHFYIGSSVNIGPRWRQHVYELQQNKHHSKYLQNAWNKYGGGSFSFSILEYCDKSKTVEREQYYMDTLKPQYNMSSEAHAPVNVIISDETRLKMSQNSTWKEKIVQLSRAGDPIKEWDSAAQAAKKLNIDDSSIRKVCNGKMKTYKGFIWRKLAEVNSALEKK